MYSSILVGNFKIIKTLNLSCLEESYPVSKYEHDGAYYVYSEFLRKCRISRRVLRAWYFYAQCLSLRRPVTGYHYLPES